MNHKEELPTCWVLTDGNAGMENQCLGLAQAVGLVPEIKRVQLCAPWRWMPPMIGARAWVKPLAGLAPGSDALLPPWPDLLIATGRATVGLSVAIRQISAASRAVPTCTVQIQNPHFPVSAFDLVVTPQHDRLSGPNVISTVGSIHHVTRAQLDEAAAELAPGLAHLPSPRIAVLVGGANKAYRMTPEIISRLCVGLYELHQACGGGLMVTPSRRTGRENIAALREGLRDIPHVIWDGESENPYFGYLGLADAVIVTSDSVNMATEACAAGKPVHVYHLPGGSRKFDAFHEAMKERGATRSFTPGEVRQLESWTLPEIDDTAIVADAVRRLLNMSP